MGDIVNLRAARKLKDRSKKRAQADANAMKSGRTKTVRQAEDMLDEKTRRDLDGHIRE